LRNRIRARGRLPNGRWRAGRASSSPKSPCPVSLTAELNVFRSHRRDFTIDEKAGYGSPPHSCRQIYSRGVPGVKATPRRTSPKPAVLSVKKLSLSGRVVALTVSVIATSLFGSAPWSPLPLMVEVIA
jgi:hypothetical protein